MQPWYRFALDAFGIFIKSAISEHSEHIYDILLLHKDKFISPVVL